MTDDKLYTSLSANTIMAKVTNHFQPTKLITSSTLSLYSLLPPVGHGATTMSLFHRVLSFAIACASPHDKPISLRSVSTVFLQVVLGLPLVLLPAGVHLRATLGILSGDIRKTCPSHLSRRFLISRSILVHPVFWYRSLLEILLGHKMLQTAIVKSIHFIYVPLDNSPAFRAVQWHRFNVTVVDADFSLKAILLRLPDVF